MSTTPRRERSDRPKATGLHWRSHKSHFVWAFAGKMPDTSPLSVLCEPAQSKCTWTFHTSHFVEIYRGNAGRIARDQRFAGACAVEMDMDSSQEPFCVEIYRGNPGCIARPAFCASLHNRNGHGLCGNFKGKCRTRLPRHPFCASLGNRHAHGHFARAILWKFTRNWPDTDDTTSIEHRALTPTVKLEAYLALIQASPHNKGNAA